MTEPNSQTDKPEDQRRYHRELLKKGLRCDLDQYEMLKRCADKEDMTEWNEWRKEHPDEDIWLQGADLCGFYLKCAKLFGADLCGANLIEAKLQDADFSRAIVDGETLIWRCQIDHKTKFEGVVLDAARIYPATRQLLEYNVRRMNWEAWYKYKKWEDNKEERNTVVRALMLFVRLFWSFSDYGLLTWRIILTFSFLSLLFAAIYSNWACWFPPGVVSHLGVEPHLPAWHHLMLLILRPVYFSVVTMTTLGFGDMCANAQNIWGHILLIFQVFLGYVLLGALITRFAVLFTAGGPAGRFADEKTIWQWLKGLCRNASNLPLHFIL